MHHARQGHKPLQQLSAKKDKDIQVPSSWIEKNLTLYTQSFGVCNLRQPHFSSSLSTPSRPLALIMQEHNQGENWTNGMENIPASDVPLDLNWDFGGAEAG